MADTELNQSQSRAVNHRGKHLLVLAGAGSGKTRTIIARAQRLMADGTPPSRVLLLTFTRKSSMEMIRRLKKTGAEGAERVIAGTFHYVAILLMRRHPDMFDNGQFMIIDRDDQEHLMKFARTAVADDQKQIPKAAALLDIFSYARNSYVSLDDYLDMHASYLPDIRKCIIDILWEYQKQKKSLGYLDFDDVLFFFLQKLREDAVGNYFRGSFDHILVDEMQDTNPLQWEILKTLTNPATLFCVGDDAQSIYAFRGADFRNVHEFQNRIPNSEVVKLEKNYRSSDPILNLANHVLAQSSLNYDKTLTGVRGDLGPVILRNFSGPYDEARWIVDDLKKNHAESGVWNNTMVMLRSAYTGKTLEGFLIEHKIPYRFIGGIGLLQSAHIKDLLAFCRASLNHRDKLAWIRYLSLWPGLGERRAVKITLEMATFGSLGEAIKKLTLKFPNRDSVFDGCLDNINERTSVPDALKKAVTFLSPMLEERYGDSWYRRVRDFDILVELSRKYDGIQEFIETYTLDPISASVYQNPTDNDAITLITVHSAKGTEADICYIIQAQSGNFPHRRSLGKEDAEEEERRILYVAITRAKNKLILTRHEGQQRNQFFGGTKAIASRPENENFLADIDHLVQSDATIPTHSMINTFPFFRSKRF